MDDIQQGADRLAREKRTIETMIRMYCRDLHHPADKLCTDCTALLSYALQRLEHCTFGPEKPKCSACPVHCYKPAMREAIRSVMAYAGPRMLVRHPVLALGHVVDGLRHPARGENARPGSRHAS